MHILFTKIWSIMFLFFLFRLGSFNMENLTRRKRRRSSEECFG